MPELQQQARIMVSGEDDLALRHLLELLAVQSLQVAPGLVVQLELTADRASRANPDLLLISLSDNLEAAQAAIREARQSCGAYIVAIGPASDASLILKCLHDGADEYLDSSKLNQEIASALTRFERKRLSRSGESKPGDVISVIGVCGGTGASTIAVNVAGVLAKKHGSAGLIDLRLSSADLAALLSLRPQHTLADFSAHADRLDRTLFDQMFTRHSSGIELMAAPWEPRLGLGVTPQHLRLLLAMGRAKFPYQVLDLDNHLDDLAMEGLWQSDIILVATRLDYVAVRNGRRMLDRLGELGIEQTRIRVVANRYGQPKELTVEQAQSALGVKISNFVADSPRGVNRYANEGKLIALQSTWSRIGRNLSDLAFSVNGKKK